MNKKFYITTPIYYPSAEAHIGHAYCTVLCDVAARYHRLKGDDTYFLTGTDEHGEKIQKNAEKAGVTPQEFVDNIASKFIELWKVLEISNDDFIRTTQDRHVKVVQQIFSNFVKKDDIYLGNYEGWYCTPCESFWTDTQVGEDHLCPDCGRPVHKATEEAYFFRMGKYVNDLLKLYEDNPNFIVPVEKKNEMINTFIKPGLEDLCVSRTSFSWGIPLNENPKHVVYVWLDALTNYITALGYLSEDDSKFQKYWNDPNTEIVHVVGADITRFHTIYWPIFLNSLGLRQPNKVIVHGLLMMKDGKMSKSKGNVISPYPLIERYGVDAVRYYLVKEVEFGKDGQFTPEQFVERVNGDLANNFGNLVNRTVSMINKYFEGKVPSFVSGVTPFDKDLEDVIAKGIVGYTQELDDMKITNGFNYAMDILSRANKYIEENAPWTLSKEGRVKELESVMSHLAYSIYVASILLSPALVNKSKQALDQLGIKEEDRTFDKLNDTSVLDNIVVNKGEQLFPRLDAVVETEYIKSLMEKK